MAKMLFANKARSTLSASVAPADVSIYLSTAGGALFPTPGAGETFQIVVASADGTSYEIMSCTARASDTLTVTRAQEGTAAQSFLAGARVGCRPTRDTMYLFPQRSNSETVTGLWAFSGANTHTGVETHTGAETHSGVETHSGDETHTGLESFAKTKFSVAHGAAYLNNLAFSAAVAANALTVSLIGDDGAAPSATNPGQAAFRSSTATTGTSTVRTATAAASVVIPDGATLGRLASEQDFIYVYALDNAGTIEAAVTGTPQNTSALATTTAIDTSSDSKTGFYSTTARTSVPIRYVGRILITHGGTLGQWSAAPTSLHAASEAPPAYALGYGQTWTDVSGSRALATTYTNSTGRPIQVNAILTAAGGFTSYTGSLLVGEVTANITVAKDGANYNGSTGNSGYITLSAVIPPGHVYQVTTPNSMTIDAWAELR